MVVMLVKQVVQDVRLLQVDAATDIAQVTSGTVRDRMGDEDQQIAGGVMKLIGSLILWTFITIAFFEWYAREQRQSENPRWEDIQEELHELGLTDSSKRR